MSLPVRVASPFLRARFRETFVLMVAALLVPFLVHLIPWQGDRPAGVYLLPVFWTAFVAVYLHGIRVGLLVGLMLPAVNLLLTGLPVLDHLEGMSIELVAYVLAAGWLVNRWPGFWLAAPLAYLPAKAVAIAAGFLVPALHDGRDPLIHFAESISNGAAGLGALLVINFVLVRRARRDPDWDSD